MDKYLVFENSGEIDPRSISTFGVNSKEAGNNPVGLFGTGLKYAISILLRSGCGIMIHSGMKTHTFAVRKTKIRKDEFNIITMNRRALGFTTELGKTWEMWQALREIYCNCLDERGSYYCSSDEPTPKKGVTQVIVWGQPFMDAWDARDSVFLSTRPLEGCGAEGARAHIHPGPSHFAYYRGIRAFSLPKPARFTYNILRKCDLTEDRTLKYTWDVNQNVAAAIMACENEQVIRTAVTSPEGEFEHDLSFNGNDPSETYISTLGVLMRDNRYQVRPSAREGIRPYLTSMGKDMVVQDLDELDSKRLRTAQNFLMQMGFDISKYALKVSPHLGDGTLGCADRGTREIWLSDRVFNMGTKQLVTTLLEEFLHLDRSLHDFTREMQDFLFDHWVSAEERLQDSAL